MALRIGFSLTAPFPLPTFPYTENVDSDDSDLPPLESDSDAIASKSDGVAKSLFSAFVASELDGDTREEPLGKSRPLCESLSKRRRVLMEYAQGPREEEDDAEADAFAHPHKTPFSADRVGIYAGASTPLRPDSALLGVPLLPVQPDPSGFLVPPPRHHFLVQPIPDSLVGDEAASSAPQVDENIFPSSSYISPLRPKRERAGEVEAGLKTPPAGVSSASPVVKPSPDKVLSPMGYHYTQHFDQHLKNKEVKGFAGKKLQTIATPSTHQRAKAIQTHYSEIRKRGWTKTDPAHVPLKESPIRDGRVVISRIGPNHLRVEEGDKFTDFTTHSTLDSATKQERRRLYPTDGTNVVTLPGSQFHQVVQAH